MEAGSETAQHARASRRAGGVQCGLRQKSTAAQHEPALFRSGAGRPWSRPVRHPARRARSAIRRNRCWRACAPHSCRPRWLSLSAQTHAGRQWSALQRPAIPRGPLCSPELIPAEDIGCGDRASNTPLLHGRHASPRGYPTGGVAPEGRWPFTGSYKAQNSERGPPDATTSAYFGS